MTDITLHGWTVDIDSDEVSETTGYRLVLLSTNIPFSDGDSLHFFNAAGTSVPEALRSLGDQLSAASKVMIWLGADSTHEKVHEFALHIISAAYQIEHAALMGAAA